MSKERASVRRIYVVVSHDGMLCNFADSESEAMRMTDECDFQHTEPHRVVPYVRAAARTPADGEGR